MKKAFSLVELAIVLVVIGLLSATIVGGQKLVEQMKTKKVISEVKTIQSALTTFNTMYDAFPGDMADATSYWTSGTDNGDGDKAIEVTADSSGTGSSETGRAFQHLSLAGLVDGSYTVGNVLETTPALAYDSKISKNAVYILTSFCLIKDTVLTDNNHCGGNTDSVIRLGSAQSVEDHTDSYVGYGILTIEQASSIDSKIDDGKPRRGFIYSHNEYTVVSVSDDTREKAGCLRFETSLGATALTSTDVDLAFYNYGEDFKCNMSFDIDILNL